MRAGIAFDAVGRRAVGGDVERLVLLARVVEVPRAPRRCWWRWPRRRACRAARRSRSDARSACPRPVRDGVWKKLEQRRALAVGVRVDQRLVLLESSGSRTGHGRVAELPAEVRTLEVAGDALDRDEVERLVAPASARRWCRRTARGETSRAWCRPRDRRSAPSSRWKWNRLPCVSLVPDLVITLTTPPAVRPNSAGAPLAITWNSLTASSVMSIAARWPPTCSPKNPLLKSPPSRLMLLKTPRWPANVISSPSGALHHADTGRERQEIFELAAENRRRLDRRLVQRAGHRRARGFDDRRCRR